MRNNRVEPKVFVKKSTSEKKNVSNPSLEILFAGEFVERRVSLIEAEGRELDKIYDLELVEYFSKHGEASVTLFCGKIIQAQANTLWGTNFIFLTHGIPVNIKSPIAPFALELDTGENKVHKSSSGSFQKHSLTPKNRIVIYINGFSILKLLKTCKKSSLDNLMDDCLKMIDRSLLGSSENFLLEISHEEYYDLIEFDRTAGLNICPTSIIKTKK